jgi:hypothetical protein
MKNILKKYTIIIAMLFIAVHTSAQQAYEMPGIISRCNNQITVSVNPQVVLISIIQEISRYPTFLGFLMATDTSDYKIDVNSYFRQYKEHPVVKMFDRLSSQPRMLNFSAPSNIMLYTDSNLRLRGDIVIDSLVTNRAGGNDSLTVFLDLLRDFAIQSSFNRFYLEQED